MEKKSNLGARFVGGTIFVVVIFGLIWLRELATLPFDILAALCGVIGGFELLKMLKDESKISRVFLVIFAVVAIPASIFYNEIGVLIIFGILFAVRAMIATFQNEDIVKTLSSYIFSVAYPTLLFTFLMHMNHWGDVGTVALLAVFMIGPFCDVGAYIFGVTIGGKKLCPRVSPNKTIAGAIGGVLGGLLGGFTVYWISTSFIIQSGINSSGAMLACFLILGFVGAVFTELGDLVESAIKRSAGVKDSGKVLPGHGGILDRFDGLIMVMLLVYSIFSIFII